jgi:hypothetical protein
MDKVNPQHALVKGVEDQLVRRAVGPDEKRRVAAVAVPVNQRDGCSRF